MSSNSLGIVAEEALGALSILISSVRLRYVDEDGGKCAGSSGTPQEALGALSISIPSDCRTLTKWEESVLVPQWMLVFLQSQKGFCLWALSLACAAVGASEALALALAATSLSCWLSIVEIAPEAFTVIKFVATQTS